MLKDFYFRKEILKDLPILIIHSASADASAAKYTEMSAILGFLGHIRPPCPSLCPPPKKR